MKSFIVFENFTGIDWNDPEYRRIILSGSTYSEAELRAWVSKTWRFITFTKEPTIAELANVIAGGGWGLLEKSLDTP